MSNTSNRYDLSGNATTNTYTANNLNQYTQVGRDAPIAPPVAFSYDADGNMTNDGRFTYTFDAENRLLSACPIAPAENALAVENAYDHQHRRIVKRVECFDGDEWQTRETHTFAYDGCNIVLERIAFTDGTTRTCEYFWGNDLSGRTRIEAEDNMGTGPQGFSEGHASSSTTSCDA